MSHDYYLYPYYNIKVIIKVSKTLNFLKSFLFLPLAFPIFPIIPQNHYLFLSSIWSLLSEVFMCPAQPAVRPNLSHSQPEAA